jgi:hypothetical protein
MEGIAGRSRLVGDDEAIGTVPDALQHPPGRRRVVGDPAVILRLAVLPGDRDGDRCLVDVKTDEPGTLRHGPASRMWLCAGKLRLPAQSAMLRECRSFHVD